MSNFDATSAAAPMAAGVIALMRQANPALTWRDVKLILAETSRKVQPDDPRWVTGAPVYLTPGTRYSHSLENGFGALNAKAAVERAITWTNVPALHTLDTGWQGYSGLPVPNDDGATSLELTFTIEEEIPFIEYIHIPMAMNHDFFRELQIELISPSGIVAVLQSSRVLESRLRITIGGVTSITLATPCIWVRAPKAFGPCGLQTLRPRRISTMATPPSRPPPGGLRGGGCGSTGTATCRAARSSRALAPSRRARAA